MASNIWRRHFGLDYGVSAVKHATYPDYVHTEFLIYFAPCRLENAGSGVENEYYLHKCRNDRLNIQNTTLNNLTLHDVPVDCSK